MAFPTSAPPPKNSQFSPEIMGQLQKQNAPAKEMSPQEIVKQVTEKEGGPPFLNAYAALVTAVKSPKFRILRANNSLFPYAIKGNGVIVGHILSADDPQKMVESLKQIKQALKVAGFKQLKSSTIKPEVLNAYKQAGFNVQESMGQRAVGKKASPAIEMTINLQGD
jgi:hypothetical protein